MFWVGLVSMQLSPAQDARIFDVIDRVANADLSEKTSIKDHRGLTHIIFVQDCDIFYCTLKSDTVNLSCTDTRSSNPLPILADDTLSLFWREEIGSRAVVYYRRHLILAPIGLWTGPMCLFAKVKEHPSPFPLPQGAREKCSQDPK